MGTKTKFVLLVSAFLLTMCKTYANDPITYQNGLSCENYVDYRFFEWQGEEYRFYVRGEGADCSYMCPDSTQEQINIAGSISPFYAASSEELNAEFCGMALQPTPTEPPETATPTPGVSPSPRAQVSPTVTLMVTVPAQNPVLAGTVSMCDLGGKLINFRIVQPPPDLSSSTLEVQIAEQESTCYVNPTNRSLMTCTIPAQVSFPASIVVRVDGVLVNDFVYSGLGCTVLTTPTPDLNRDNYP